jgi:hypothetical protein
MRNAFCLSLEAVNPALDRFRAYRLEAGPDLFGVWLVDVTYGRIGTRGHRRRYVADDEAGARKIVRQTLCRRATAKQRIGVSYHVCDVIDPGQWVRLQEGVELVSATLNPEE